MAGYGVLAQGSGPERLYSEATRSEVPCTLYQMSWTTSIHPLDDEAAQARWRALWEGSPQRSCFSSLAYVRAAAAAYGLRCEMHLVASDDGQDEAGALIYWRRRGPYRVVALPPFTQYSPLLLGQRSSEAAVHARRSAFEALLAALEARFDVLRLLCHALPDVRAARWRAWRAVPFYTYHLMLHDADDLVGRWSAGTRRAFLKHEAAYRVDEDPAAVSAIVGLCAEGYARHGRRLPADASRLRALIDALGREGMVRLFAATPRDGDAPEAGLAVLHDGRTAHYWIAGSVPGPAMTVLLGRLLPRLRADGLEGFDFVGANTPTIAEFKRHFGPVLTSYFLIEKVARPALRLLFRLTGR